MKSENYDQVREKGEFSEFTNFFLKYLKGCSSFDEAFKLATVTCTKLFNKTPYQNCQSFLSDFYKAQYENSLII